MKADRTRPASSRRSRRLRVVLLVGACLALIVSAVGALRRAATDGAARHDGAVAAAADAGAAGISARIGETARLTGLLARSPALTRGGALRSGDPGATAALAAVGDVPAGAVDRALLVRADGRVIATSGAGSDVGLPASAPVQAAVDAALGLAPGVVLHSTPRRSGRSGTPAVISTVAIGAGGDRAALVVETPVAWLTAGIAPADPSITLRVADRRSGRLIHTSGSARTGEEAIARAIADLPADARRGAVGGDPAALAVVDAGPGDANRWVVAASRPAAAGWSWRRPDPLTLVTIASSAALLLLLATWLRTTRRDLRRARTIDPLSGLPGRAALVERGSRALARAEHQGTSTAVLLINLMRFREVNDALGHAAGDRILAELAARLAGSTRSGDLVARMGGDEFALLLTSVTGPDGAEQAAERLRALLHEPFEFEGLPVGIHAAIGLAMAPDDAAGIDELVRCAGVAMYAAKRRGEELVRYRQGLETLAPERLALLNDLRAAVRSDEIHLHYQPKVNLATGAVDGVEALARWDHPRLGLLPPADFVPLAEETGLVSLLTRRVVSVALAQCRAWLDEGLELQIAVNLSARCIQDPATVELISRGLTRWRVPARLLKIEVTETAVVHEPDVAGRVIARLDALGVGVSIDDYGTGYSSLVSIRTMPVRELKIDRLFLEQVAAGHADRSIVRSTVELGHRLGLRVVAEGVETREAVRSLMSLGCDAAQGNWFCEPLPPDELRAWLAERNRTGAARR